VFSIGGDFDKIGKVTNMVDTIGVTIKTNSHINDLVTNSNAVITGEFVLHMSKEAMGSPKKFQHMYEWGHVGDPNYRLWKHILRGRGAQRQLTWDFKASTKSVPVAPALKAIGVKQNHIFTWKAPVLELGLPVHISPILAKFLVFEAKETSRRSAISGKGFEHGGIVFHDGTIAIAKQGNEQSWNAFTTAFNEWFKSGMPEMVIRTNIGAIAQKTIKRTALQKLASIASLKTKTKTFTLQPIGIDAGFQTKLANSLRANYIAGAANRRVLVADDEL